MDIITDKKDPMTSNLYWLTAALTKKKADLRGHINHVYVKDGTITATDGNRLHHLKYTNGRDYDNGFYKVIKRTKSSIILSYNEESAKLNYPNIEALIEKPEGHEIIAQRKEDFKTGKIHSFYVYTEIIRALFENTIDYEYLNDALADDNEYTVTIKDDTSPIHFEREDRIALLMPLRI